MNLYLRYKKEGINILLWLMASMTILTVFYCLPRGIMFFDESWFLYLNSHPELHLNYGTDWGGLSKNWFPKTLLFGRYLIVLLMSFSAFLFSKGLCSFLKKDFKTVFLLSLIFTFIFYSPIVFYPNYVTFGFIVILSSIGLLLLGVNNRFAIVASGMLSCFCPIIMITTSPLILVIVLYLYLFSKANKNPNTAKLPVFFTVGLLLGYLLIFFFYKSPFVFMEEFKDALEIQSEITTHGGWQMMNWLKETALYFAFCAILPASVLYLIKSKKNYKWFVSILFILTLVVFYVGVYTHHRNINQPTIVLIFCIIGLIEAYKEKRKTIFITGIFLVLVAVFAGFGSDVEFWIRNTIYIVIYGSFTYFIINEKDKKVFLLFVVLPQLIIFTFYYTNSNGWQRYNISKQTEELDFRNETSGVYINKGRYNTLKNFNQILSKNDIIVSNSRVLWGVYYCLDLKTNQRAFTFYEKNAKISSLTKMKGFERAVFIEDKLKKPLFSKEYVKTLQKLNPDTLGIIDDRYVIVGVPIMKSK